MDALWTKCLDRLKQELGEISLETWLSPLKVKKEGSSSLVLEAPDAFFKDWIETNYLNKIKDIAKEITSRDYDIRLEVNPNLLKRKTNKIFKSIGKQFKEAPQASLRLNPRFTFEGFVVGGSNRMAHAASLAVASSPGKAYNPLFLYGGVGLGKTHLIQAIAHHIHTANPQLKIKYLSSERFTNELISSIQNKTTQKFRHKYREVDVLLIDDIQFLAGKEAVQEEFFHTFNVLYDYHKQIIITSDRPPREIPRLKERVVSRFGWGLVVDLQLPDFETRVAILKKKIEKEIIDINDEVITFVAENITTNIRELEGALVRIIAHSVLQNKTITLELAKDILKDMVKEIYRKITPDTILNKVAEYFDVSVVDLKGGKRNKALIFPRQVTMYLLRNLTNLSFPEIGRVLGAKHHTTILYAYKKVEERLKRDVKIKMIIQSLTQDIKSL